MFFSLFEKLRRFMYGRYGGDSLNGFLLVLLALTAAVNMFFRNPVVYVVQWVLLITVVLRMLSKNIYRRTRENGAFLKIYEPVKKKFKLFVRIIKERKYRVYKRCPACRAVISLPRKKGKHGVKCPKCGNNFKINIRF